jgi:hypothetical protein
MKYCSYCKVKVNTDSNRCPLCLIEVSPGVEDELSAVSDKQESTSEGLGEDRQENAPEVEGVISTEAIGEGESSEESTDNSSDRALPRVGKYPPSKELEADRYNMAIRLLVFISVVLGSTSLLINIMTYEGVLWSLVVIGSILFLWAAIAYPIIFKRNIGQIVIVEAVSTCIFIYLIEWFTQSKGWGLTYVTPFLLIGATFFITLIILIKRPKWREYTVYQTVMVILGFLPVIFCIFGLVTVIWPSVVSAFYSFLTITGMYILAHKKYETELKKRFHI